jgi:pSer/pThr/pTyr-binding forkhead associated (FHA) protein
VYRGDQFLRRVELGEAPTRVGRAPENELVLEDPNKGVSRTHAQILFERGRYVVVDLNSQNGVWIGDRRVTRDTIPVDVPVTIGPYRLVLAPDPQPVEVADTVAVSPIAAELIEPPAEPTEIAGPEARVAATQAKTAQAKPTQDKPTPAKPAAAKAAPAKATQAKTGAPVPPARKSSRAGILAVVGGVAAILAVTAVLLVLANNRRAARVDRTPTPAPAGPTAAERFQDHYDKSQRYIESGDKAAALRENTEALSASPSEPRGLQQQATIAAMADAVPPPVDVVPEDTVVAPPAPDLPAGGGAVVSTVAATLRVTAKPGETAAERTDREKRARSLLDDGKKALEERRYSAAISQLQAAIRESGRPDFGHVKDQASSLLQDAQTAQARIDAGAKRETALRLVEEAKVLASADNLLGAVEKVREARNLDPQVAGAAEVLSRVQERARVLGEQFLSSARNFDSFKRTEDAIKDYDKAVQLLELIPGGHKDLASAKQRITELKTLR